MLSNFWDSLWLMLTFFFFVAYLMILFQVVVDLFRNHEMGGFSRALWVIGLVLLPMLTLLAYILIHGRGISTRQQRAIERAKSDTDAYIRSVAHKSPAEQIADAKKLLDEGVISAEEFERLKTKALA